MKQCPFCFKKVDDNDISCQHCGRAIYSIGKTIQSEPQVKLTKESQGEDQNNNIRSNKGRTIVFWIIVISVGLYIIVDGYIGFQRRDILERDGGHAVGEVVDISCWYDDWSNGCDYEIRFKIPDGKTFKFSTSYLVDVDLGDQVKVVYSFENPQNAGIQGVGKGGLIMSILFGVVILLWGIWGVSPIVKQW